MDSSLSTWSYPKLDGIGTQGWVIGSRSYGNVQGAGCALALGGGCHNLQSMIAHWQSLVDGITFGNLLAIEQPCHSGVVNRSHLDFQLIISLAVYLGISQVGVQDTWIVIFADSEVWFIVRRARRQCSSACECEANGEKHHP